MLYLLHPAHSVSWLISTKTHTSPHVCPLWKFPLNPNTLVNDIVIIMLSCYPQWIFLLKPTHFVTDSGKPTIVHCSRLIVFQWPAGFPGWEGCSCIVRCYYHSPLMRPWVINQLPASSGLSPYCVTNWINWNLDQFFSLWTSLLNHVAMATNQWVHSLGSQQKHLLPNSLKLN